MVGLPASGKSTRVRAMTDMDPDAYVYSTDNIVERIAEQLGKTYEEVWEKHVSSAQKEADIFLAEAIKHKQDVIWDQTNLGAGKRRKIVKRMQQAGYEVVCECFMQPTAVDDVAEWNWRLHNRPGKSIPDHVIKNMINTFVLPTEEEGFNNIAFFDIYGKEVVPA